MSPDLIFKAGLIICGAAAAAAVISVIVLSAAKKRLDRRLDAEYGKRRR